jgi:hypothetical protein
MAASEQRRVRAYDASPLPTRAAALIERGWKACGIIKGLKEGLGPKLWKAGRDGGYDYSGITADTATLGADLLTSMELS